MILVLTGIWAVPVIFSILILGTLGLSQDAFAAGFIKIGDIEGEADDKAHKKWIDILAINFDDLTKITVVKQWDASSPGLIGAVCNGVAPDPGAGIICEESTVSDPPTSDVPLVLPFSTVEIDICRTTHGKELQCYLQFKLTNVRITSYSISGSTEGEQVPTEQVSLNYEAITVTYTKFDDKGKKGDTIEYSWIVEDGTA